MILKMLDDIQISNGPVVWMFNIGADSLEHSSEKNTSGEVIHQMEEMLLMIARERDYVIMREKPNEELCNYLIRIGKKMPQIILPAKDYDSGKNISEIVAEDEEMLTEIKNVFQQNQSAVFQPYIVTEHEEKIARECGILDKMISPDIVKKVNDKEFSFLTNRKLGLEYLPAKVCHSYEEIEAAVEELRTKSKTGKVVIKEPFESSGKGIHVIANDMDLRIFKRVVKKKGICIDGAKWIVEMWCERATDLNCQMYIHKTGEVEIFSIKEQIMNGVITVGANNPPELDEQVLKEYSTACEKIGRQIFETGYYGFAGIDSIYSKEGIMYPLIEVNARINLSTCISFLKEIVGETKMRSMYYDVYLKEQLSYRELMAGLTDRGLLYDGSKNGIIIYVSRSLPELREQGKDSFAGRVFALFIGEDYKYINEIEHSFCQYLDELSI